MGETTTRPRVRTLRTAAEILRAFTARTPSWSLAELVAHTGWTKPTTHRFLSELVDIGMLERDTAGRYRIGPFCMELGAMYMAVHPRRAQLMSHLGELTAATGLTSHLGVLSGTRVLVVASNSGDGALTAAARVGQEVPLHASALGKAILSQLPPDEAAALLPVPLARFTDATITSVDALLAEVDPGHGKTVFVARDEFAHGVEAMAIPLLPGLIGPQPAALSCAGPTSAVLPGVDWAKAAEVLEMIYASVTPTSTPR